jgi:hypothetical protein
MKEKFMTAESSALLKEFHFIINQHTLDMTDSLFGQQDIKNPLLHLSDDDISVIRIMSLNSHQKAILQKGMLALGQEIVFSILCVLDGVSDVTPAIPDLAIVIRETKKEISDSYLHDEFIELLDE